MYRVHAVNLHSAGRYTEWQNASIANHGSDNPLITLMYTTIHSKSQAGKRPLETANLHCSLEESQP